MNRIFTLNIFTGFKKVLLIGVIAFMAMAVESFISYKPETSIDIQDKIVKCYPNPAISFVNFEFSTDVISKNYYLQVYSFTGKKMYETRVTNNKLTLTFSNDFYRGIYVYQFTDKSGKILETGKFQITQ